MLEVPLLTTKKGLSIWLSKKQNLITWKKLEILCAHSVSWLFWGILPVLACLISEWSPVGLVKYSVRYTRGLWHQPDLCKTLYSPFYMSSVSDEVQHKRTFCAKKRHTLGCTKKTNLKVLHNISLNALHYWPLKGELHRKNGLQMLSAFKLKWVMSGNTSFCQGAS